MGDKKILKLSEAFANKEFLKDKNSEVKFEWTATLLNINIGHNQQLMEKCKPLKGYSMFVHLVRRYTEDTGSFENGFEKAVEECIRLGYLADILKKNRAEVHQVCLFEFDQEKHDRIVKAESYNIGLNEGRIEGIKNTITALLSFGISKDQICLKLKEQYSLQQEEADKMMNECMPTIN